MKQLTNLFLVLMLALSLAACGSSKTTATDSTATTNTPTKEAATETAAQDVSDQETAGISFTVTVTDLSGSETTFDYTSEAATVGEALLAEGLIAGDDSEYGLYITSVNGITADWDKEQTYWAFYIDGEYATTGVDSTEIEEGKVYSFVLTGAQETASEAADVTVLGEGATVFAFSTVDLEGTETAYEIHTDETTVGAALLALEVIAGDDGEYGLYVTSVNGITADWDKEQTYWAFYVDGEYATTGVDSTEIEEGKVYSFVLTKG